MTERITQTIKVGSPNGTLEAYGHTWPTFDVPILYAKLEGCVEVGEFTAASLEVELRQRLAGLPFEVRIEEGNKVTLSEKDQAEYDALLAVVEEREK